MQKVWLNAKIKAEPYDIQVETALLQIVADPISHGKAE